MTDYFIQVIGTNCTGKSQLVGSLKDYFTDSSIYVVGLYKKSKTFPDLYTGGIDLTRTRDISPNKEDGKKLGLISKKGNITNKGRHRLLEEAWFSDKKVVVCEGFTITGYKAYIRKYIDEYCLKKPRAIIVVLIEKNPELRKSEMIIRSGGKSFTEKRLSNFIEYEKDAKKVFDACLQNNIATKSLIISGIEDYNKVQEEFNSLVRECLEE